MKVTEYIYPDINGKEREVKLHLNIFDNLEYEILDCYSEDHDDLSRIELKDIAYDYIDYGWLQDVVTRENERRRVEQEEQKLDQMRVNEVESRQRYS